MADPFLICSLLFFFSVFGLSTEQQQPSISGPERLALLQLRSSLGLRARQWPIRSDPCASWLGVQCTTGGRVAGINISGFRRTRRGGQNPHFSVDPLRNLTMLSSFNASDFALPGPIPGWFGTQLHSLQVLDLRSCSISGSIPPTLGNLSSLTQLYLSQNNLTGVIPPSLSLLVGLNELDLSENSLTGFVPAALSALRNLTLLDLSSNFLTGAIPPEIGAILGLQTLNLGFNSLSGHLPLSLGNLRNLQRLIIGSNSISGGLPVNLFSNLSQLEFVVLSRNNFTGEFPNILWSLPSLRVLDASVNNLSNTLPNASSRVDTVNNNVNASVFNISHNSFYGNITPVIRGFSFVDISGNYFEGPIPNYARVSTSLGNNCLRNSSGQRSVSECRSFYSDRNLMFDNFGEPYDSPSPSPSPASTQSENRSNRRLVIILASVFGGLGLIVLLILTILLVIACRRRRGVGNTNQSGGAGVSVGPVAESGTGGTLPQGAIMDFSKLGDTFTYQQILQATGDFNEKNLMKKGHSGDLFHATLEGGVKMVIKKFDLNSSVKKELYSSEVDVFSKVSSHPRLVPLLGHCLEAEDVKFLVYKHMPNGDLSSSLFRKTSGLDDSLQSLDWITRLKIAIGVAEGLSYFHHECTPPLVHRDIQASSILLDDKFEVRLGSLSSVCAQEGDTQQSRITRLLRFPQSSDQGTSGTPNATCAYDVYCFGKVLLELVTGNLGISASADPTTKEWLDSTLPHISIYDKELVTGIVDPTLIIDEDLLEEVWAMAVVARSCLNPKPNRRPLMRYILKALENPLKVVRDEQHTSSERFRATSSRGSWNATLFGSWRHNSSDVAANPAAAAVEGSSSGKRSGTTGSAGGEGNNGNGNGNSSSARRGSREIFPEPGE